MILLDNLHKNPLLIILSLSFLIVSCIPGKSLVYQPEAPGGRVVSAHCPPDESFLLFEANEVVVGVRAKTPWDNKIIVNITFEVPEGKTVILEDQQIEVLEGEQIFAKVDVQRISDDFQTGAPMPGKTEWKLFKQITMYGTTKHAYYTFNATIPVLGKEYFYIKLPCFLVNNVRWNLPLIKFTLIEKFSLHPLNC